MQALFFSPTLFTPNLPQYKKNCIENLGFGTVDKIFLRFENKWWLPEWNGIRLLWTVEDREELLKKVLFFTYIIEKGLFFTYIIESIYKIHYAV